MLGRLRATVLVSDGMLSAFENVGSGFRPDPPPAGERRWRPAATAASCCAAVTPRPRGAPRRRWARAAAAELFRRMTTRRLGLLRPDAARAYLASLAPAAAALARGPLAALDDFYLANRAGRWSAAARQAYLLRSPLAQPLFADPVVRAARAVPLRYRVSDRLHRDVLGLLCPGLLDIPLAGTPWHGEPRTPATVVTAPPGPAAADWRRDSAGTVAGLPARLRPGPRRDEPAVRHREPAGRRTLAGLAAGRPARGLGPGHPGRAAVRRLAQRPPAARPAAGPAEPGGPQTRPAGPGRGHSELRPKLAPAAAGRCAVGRGHAGRAGRPSPGRTWSRPARRRSRPRPG